MPLIQIQQLQVPRREINRFVLQRFRHQASHIRGMAQTQNPGDFLQILRKGRIQKRRRFLVAPLQTAQIMETHGCIKNRHVSVRAEMVSVVPFLHALDDGVECLPIGFKIHHLGNRRPQFFLTESKEPSELRIRREVGRNGESRRHGIQRNGRHPRNENAGNHSVAARSRLEFRVKVLLKSVGRGNFTEFVHTVCEHRIGKLIVLIDDDIELPLKILPEYRKEAFNQCRCSVKMSLQNLVLPRVRIGCDEIIETAQDTVIKIPGHIAGRKPREDKLQNIELSGERCFVTADIGAGKIGIEIRRMRFIVVELQRIREKRLTKTPRTNDKWVVRAAVFQTFDISRLVHIEIVAESDLSVIGFPVGNLLQLVRRLRHGILSSLV